MAAPLRAWNRLLLLSGNQRPALSRSAFTASKEDLNEPDWIKVGLTFGSTIAVWVLLLKQHNELTIEYERRKAESQSVVVPNNEG
ncbi:NADH dehydrogenase [ubiquinone] 1 subunit C1, mitochondrial [Eublepharis macularius]|uniref:NADH dehydrogenase [ubiquinone] 1 subunit C1, mitochondrial n=1 Tax=Eublepharis macularius TaxID=481883 RepID=A0AA97K0Q5_EUBMA|nr:NADH dehydrogenase [ubiquinone] 1 subunit C1, mitochondrial [Eublepharis macularius]